jgi:hypothetical protein
LVYDPSGRELFVATSRNRGTEQHSVLFGIDVETGTRTMTAESPPGVTFRTLKPAVAGPEHVLAQSQQQVKQNKRTTLVRSLAWIRRDTGKPVEVRGIPLEAMANNSRRRPLPFVVGDTLILQEGSQAISAYVREPVGSK